MENESNYNHTDSKPSEHTSALPGAGAAGEVVHKTAELTVGITKKMLPELEEAIDKVALRGESAPMTTNNQAQDEAKLAQTRANLELLKSSQATPSQESQAKAA